MANRRKFLAGLGALASGSAAAMGTGAFTSVEANRQVSVNTAGDANAYLGLSGDGEYVSDDSAGGELTIDLGSPQNLGEGPTGSGDAETEGDGFNDSAVTVVEGVITGTNQGTNPIQLDFTPTGEEEGNNNYTNSETVNLPDATVEFILPSVFSVRKENTLAVGESVSIDVKVDTTDSAGGGDLDNEMTLYAYEIPSDPDT